MADEPLEDLANRLGDCRAPLLVGVRHHSAALARIVPEWLAEFKPKAVLVEMPPDFLPWIEHLGKADLEAPVALAACDEERLITFYPLADFSPELAAIRWALANKVPVVPCDLNVAAMSRLDRLHVHSDADGRTVHRMLLRQYDARDSGELWEKLVETPAADSTPEAIRRAALFFGWMVRHSANGPTPGDAHREAAMRAAVAAAPKRSAAVIGSFHAAALLSEPLLWSSPERGEDDPSTTPVSKVATALIPYSFAQLDQRSGYPAGVMDPVWRQTVLAAKNSGAVNDLVADLAVEICRRLRAEGHVAGTPDATEVVRLARDWVATVLSGFASQRQSNTTSLSAELSLLHQTGLATACALLDGLTRASVESGPSGIETFLATAIYLRRCSHELAKAKVSASS